MRRLSRDDALDVLWTRLAEIRVKNLQRAEAARQIDRAEAAQVDAGLRKCDQALLDLRAAYKALPPAILFHGGDHELDVLRRTLDRTSGALRELKMSWRDRNPHAGSDRQER